jgi:dTDP-4-amino-4,6-dideoxygalactose transaminase
MSTAPSATWPSHTVEEAEAIKNTLLSNKVNYWTGDECRKFEDEFAQWCGVSHAIAVTNGSVALDLALKALNIRPGDEVVVTPRTFIASVSCVVNVGAIPVFADVDLESGNLSAATIKAVLTSRTRAIICVHLAGWPCDMDPIMDLAKARNLSVIEDCAQAHGAQYKGRSVGSIGHIGAWSFCQDKIMTTGGEGGMVTTNDYKLWSQMWSYKDHGKSFEAVYKQKHPSGFRWLHESFGTNWRMLEIQAVIGRIQLNKIAKWTKQRNANALTFFNTLEPISGNSGPIRLSNWGCANCKSKSKIFCVTDQCVHAYYKFYFFLRLENIAPNWNRDRIIKEITALGVFCNQGTCPEVYLEKAFENTGWRPKNRLPVAKILGDTGLSLLLHPTLSTENILFIAKLVKQVLIEASLQKSKYQSA